MEIICCAKCRTVLEVIDRDQGSARSDPRSFINIEHNCKTTKEVLKENNLERYFRNGLTYMNIIDYSLRVSMDENGVIAFYIHADGKDSDTMDFEVHGDSLVPNPKVQKLPDSKKKIKKVK